MRRIITVGAAQSGPIQPGTSRAEVVERLLAQLRAAHARGCDLVAFTEVALTPFFPHWAIEDPRELESYFEREMPGPQTRPLFAEAARLGIAFYLGYAELADAGGIARRYNSAVLVGKDGQIVGKYRKIHLPGYAQVQPQQPFQNLEKRYFDVGNLGFPVWHICGGVLGMLICNDRRWPESYRMLALQGAELILLGYNTPAHNPAFPATDHLACFHNHLCMQAGAYQNGCWVVGVAKAGVEAGVDQIGQSCIIAPSGEMVAMASTLEDELIVAACDLELAQQYQRTLFNFAVNRRVEQYGLITAGAGEAAPSARY